jgi:hypothetical protein
MCRTFGHDTILTSSATKTTIMTLLLLFMFFLGIIQIVWAAILSFVTRNTERRRHLGYYFIGVLVYFILFVPLSLGVETIVGQWLLGIHFFGSAAFLACYHFYIVAKEWGQVEDAKFAPEPESESLGI